jgi:hypothetical protein
LLIEDFMMQEIHGLVVDGETSTPADGEDHSKEVQEPPPQANVVAGSRLEEATLLEGTHPITMSTHGRE